MCRSLWFWSVLPVNGEYVIEIYRPRQFTRECIKPITEGSQMKPWDLNYDPNNDPRIVPVKDKPRYTAADYATYNQLTKTWLDGVRTDDEYQYECVRIGGYFGQLASKRIKRRKQRKNKR